MTNKRHGGAGDLETIVNQLFPGRDTGGGGAAVGFDFSQLFNPFAQFGLLDPDILAQLGFSPEEIRTIMSRQVGLTPPAINVTPRGPTQAELGLTGRGLDIQQQLADLTATRDAATAAAQRAATALGEGQLEVAEREFAESQRLNRIADFTQSQVIAQGQAQTGISGFNALEAALQGRGALESGALAGLGGLTNVLGNLGLEQQKFGLDLLTTPRNAVAAFLMGQGQQGVEGFQQFDPSRILGIDANQFQGVLAQALSAAEALRTRANQPQQIDVASLVNNLNQQANAVLEGIRAAGGTPAPGQPIIDTPLVPPTGGGQPAAPFDFSNPHLSITPELQRLLDAARSGAPPGPEFARPGTGQATTPPLDTRVTRLPQGVATVSPQTAAGINPDFAAQILQDALGGTTTGFDPLGGDPRLFGQPGRPGAPATPQPTTTPTGPSATERRRLGALRQKAARAREQPTRGLDPFLQNPNQNAALNALLGSLGF